MKEYGLKPPIDSDATAVGTACLNKNSSVSVTRIQTTQRFHGDNINNLETAWRQYGIITDTHKDSIEATQTQRRDIIETAERHH